MNARAAGSPWQGPDFVVAVGLNVLGAVVILTGAVWADGLDEVTRQFPAANLSVAGLLVAGFGNIAWLLSGRRAVSRRRGRVLVDDSPSD